MILALHKQRQDSQVFKFNLGALSKFKVNLKYMRARLKTKIPKRQHPVCC